MSARAFAAALAIAGCTLPPSDRVVLRDGDAALGPPGVLRGTVRFLQGNELVLTSEAGQAVVTQNGRFAFPTPLATGQRYAVQVIENPPGQRCTVWENGSGRFDPAAELRVVCSFAQQRTAWDERVVRNGQGWEDIPTLTPIAVRVDEPSHALVWLHAGAADFQNSHADGRGNLLRIAVEREGRAVAEAVMGGGSWETTRSMEAVALVDLAPGVHNFRPRMRYEQRPVPGVTTRPLSGRLDGFTLLAGPGLSLGVIVLESLRNFVSVAQTTASRQATVRSTPEALGPAALELRASERQPALVVTHAPEVGGAPEVTLSVDDAALSAGRFHLDDQPHPMTLMGFVELAPGTHRVSSSWSSWADGATLAAPAVSQFAVLFRPSLVWGRRVGNEELRPVSGVSEPLPSLQFTTEHEGQVLVGLQLPQVFARHGTGGTAAGYGWLRLHVDGGPVTGVAAFAPPGAEHASQTCAALGMVELLAGEHTLTFEAAAYPPAAMIVGGGPVNVFAMQVE